MPAHKSTDHAFILQDLKGLPSTNDNLIGEKFVNIEFSKFDQKENCLQLIKKKIENEKITTLERVFLV